MKFPIHFPPQRECLGPCGIWLSAHSPSHCPKLVIHWEMTSWGLSLSLALFLYPSFPFPLQKGHPDVILLTSN